MTWLPENLKGSFLGEEAIMGYDVVMLERDGCLATITMDRPEVLNRHLNHLQV